MMYISQLKKTIREYSDLVSSKQYGTLFIVNYLKQMFYSNNYDVDNLYHLRSIICSGDPHSTTTDFTIYSISPSKSVPYSTFCERYPQLTENIIVEDFIEGTMINVFWDGSKWNISTKSNIGAKSNFFGLKTFDTMFEEACKSCNFNIQLLEKNISYSFVLQHPENRIVTAFSSPLLWLIEANHISEDINR